MLEFSQQSNFTAGAHTDSGSFDQFQSVFGFNASIFLCRFEYMAICSPTNFFAFIIVEIFHRFSGILKFSGDLGNLSFLGTSFSGDC